MARKQTLIHLHGSTRLADASLLNQGEIAVTHAATKAETELAVKTKVDGADVLVYIPSLDKVTGAIATAKSEVDTAAKGYANTAQTNAETTAKNYTDGVKTNLQGQIDTLSDKVGTTDVAAQIQAAVAVEETARKAADDAEETARKAADAALQEAVDAKVAQAAYDTKVGEFEAADTANTTAINNEAARAKAAEAQALTDAQTYADGLNTAMNTRVEALEDDTHTHANKALLDTYDQTNADIKDAVEKKHAHANKAELDKIVDGDKAKWDAATNAINAFMDAENVGDAVVDTLKEIQDYITTDGAAANTMTQNIAKNAQAIADEATRAKGVEAGLQTAVDAKVAQAAYNEKMAALEQADSTNATAIANEKKRAEEAEAALQDAIDAIAGEGGSLADTLQEAKDYTDGLLGDGFTTANTVAAAITAEANRADAAEKANAAAIKAISDDYLKTSDKTELQNAIDAVDTAYKAADTAFTSALDAAKARIETLEKAGYVKAVSVQNSDKNLITATEGTDGTVTLNFDNLVIDCGTY